MQMVYIMFWIGLGIFLFACMVAGSYGKSWVNKQERCDMTREELRTKLQHHGVTLTDYELDSLMKKEGTTPDIADMRRKREKKRHEKEIS